MTASRWGTALQLSTYLYFAMVVFGTMQGFLSSVLPAFGKVMELSDATIGWLFSAYAAGRLSAGILANHFLKSDITLIKIAASATLLVLGMTLVSGTSAVWTAAALLFMIGVSGGTLQAFIQAAFATISQELRSGVVARGYMWASAGVVSFPILLSMTMNVGAPWLVALLPMAVIVMALTLNSGNPIQSKDAQTQLLEAPSITLSVAGFWFLFFCINTVEWSIGLWWPSVLASSLKLDIRETLIIMSVYFSGSLAGRVGHTWAVSRYNPDLLFFLYLYTAIASTYAVVETSVYAVAVTGAFIAGFAIAALYPSNLAAALRYVPQEARRIAAGTALCAGLAMFAVPPLIGLARDLGSGELAVFVTPALLGVMMLVLALLRAKHRAQSAAAAV